MRVSQSKDLEEHTGCSGHADRAAKVGLVDVDSWFMGLISPLDAIDQSSIGPLADKFERRESIILDTAKGERRANRAIDPWQGRITDNVTPDVLRGCAMETKTEGSELILQTLNWTN